MVTDMFITDIVTPGCKQKFGENVALTIGVALLWAIYKGPTTLRLPSKLVSRVKQEYENRWGDKDCFIEQTGLLITNNNGQLQIHEGRKHDSLNGLPYSVNMELSLTNQRTIQRKLDDLSCYMEREVRELRNEMKQTLKVMSRAMNRLALSPTAVVRKENVSQSTNNEDPNAGVKLGRGPKDLYILWKEYEIGLNKGKPTKSYTSRSGHSDKTAIDLIYKTYGDSSSVTAILKRIAKNRNKI